MKYLFGIIITVCLASHVSSYEDNQTTGAQGPNVQWVNYLSHKEKAEIARELGLESIRRKEAAGTLYDADQPQEISFAASFRPKNSTSTTTEGTETAVPATTSEFSGGNVSCSINIQYPHAGSGPGGSRVVKAKSAGTCAYEHVVGTPPPTITWELFQTLTRLEPGGQFPTIVTFSNEAPRTGLSVTWSASSTQVFANSCKNGFYAHTNLVYVVPPPGWEYTGEQPIQIPNPATVTVTDC